MKETGLYDDALIIITGDHGTSLRQECWPFGDLANTHSSLYDVDLKVLLIIKAPNIPENARGKVIENQVRSIDFIPTVLDLLGFPMDKVTPPMDGESLVPSMGNLNRHKEAGYTTDVEPMEISADEKALWRELDGWIRAATLDAPESHLVYESYNDWLIDQREERKSNGIWKDSDVPEVFPIGDPNEELIMGQRAWRAWKDYFCVKRQYAGKSAM